MPLPTETAYWETVAEHSVKVSDKQWSFSDNSWKRPYQIKRLMDHQWVGEKILEIGCGNGVIGLSIKMISANAFYYTGTELSSKFREWAQKVFNLNVVEADVRELPGKGYTRIIAFDSLEHVRPEHRDEGYRRIFDVAAEGALLFIHYSYGKSAHNKEFDHPFGIEDFVHLEKVGFTLMNYDRYVCPHPAGEIPYAFAVLRK